VKEGSPEIMATNVVVVSPTWITCQFDLTGVATGAWDVTVRNPDGQEGRGPGLFGVTDVPGPLRANFTGSPRSGLPPLEVQFSDTSTGTITSWRWSFGDGRTSTEQNPSHIYERIGVYSVTLRISGSSGNYSKRVSEYIRVG
jgi:PKD repeat protein